MESAFEHIWFDTVMVLNKLFSSFMGKEDIWHDFKNIGPQFSKSFSQYSPLLGWSVYFQPNNSGLYIFKNIAHLRIWLLYYCYKKLKKNCVNLGWNMLTSS